MKSVTNEDRSRRTEEAAAMTQSVQYIELERLHPSPTNPRKHFDEESLEELAASVAEHGILQPLVVRPQGNDFEIVVGHRRHRAARRAELGQAPALVRDLDDATVLELQLVENNQRQDVSPLEEADAIEALITHHGRDPTDIAAKLGRSDSYVMRRRRLTSLVPELRQLLEAERIGLGAAEALGQLPCGGQHELAAGRLSSEYTGHHGKPQCWSNQEVQWAIHHTTRKIEHACWELDEEFEGLPTCEGCAMRSGAQAALPGLDDAEDRCLNARCWETKVETKLAERLAELLERGYREFGEEQRAERRKDYRAWVDVEDKCWRDEEGRTWGELAPDAPRYVELRATCGEIRESYHLSQSDVYTTLKQEDPALYYRVSGKTNPEKTAQAKARQDDLREKRGKIMEWAGQQELSGAILELVARSFLIERKWVWGDMIEELADGEALQGDPRTYIERCIERGDSSELVRLVAACALTGTALQHSSHLSRWSEAAGLDQETQT